MGRSGGAVLHDNPSLQEGAQIVAGLLNEPARLAQLGKAGRDFVVTNYALERICSSWEEILADNPSLISRHCRPWNYTKGLRYWVERAAGMLKASNRYRQLLDLAKHQTQT